LVHSALNSIAGKRTGGSIFFTPPELLFRVVSGLLGEVRLKSYCQRSGFRSSFDAAEESSAAFRLEPQLRCLTVPAISSLCSVSAGLAISGIQFPNKFGHRAATVGRGPENAALAEKLGAHH